MSSQLNTHENAHKAALYFLKESCLSLGPHFIGSKTKKISFSLNETREMIYSLNETSSMQDLIFFLENLCFKKTSFKLNETLIQWIEGKINLQLVDYIPSPQEVLQIQSKGQRIVSLISSEKYLLLKEKLQLHHNTAYEFFLHDLHHAGKFYHTNNFHSIQCFLYRELCTIIDHPLIQNLLHRKEFKMQWDYLISDMNTHPIHQLKYFKFIFSQHCDARQWTDVLSPVFHEDSYVLDALNHLNTPEEKTAHHLTIMNWPILLNAPSF